MLMTLRSITQNEILLTEAGKRKEGVWMPKGKQGKRQLSPAAPLSSHILLSLLSKNNPLWLLSGCRQRDAGSCPLLGADPYLTFSLLAAEGDWRLGLGSRAHRILQQADFLGDIHC